jgi:large subunit ribosomal protein L21
MATVQEHKEGPEVTIFKKKRRKNYKRTNFFRAQLTNLKIDDIVFDYEKYVEASKSEKK